jgi:uncharacterized membrane protein YsdA (DUF1294 family)
MSNSIYIVYLVSINLISGITFAFDKRASIKNYRRVPEQILHLLEVLGGVFSVLVLMYSLHHKNQKFSYYGWTWMAFLWWMIFFIILKI